MPLAYICWHIPAESPAGTGWHMLNRRIQSQSTNSVNMSWAQLPTHWIAQWALRREPRKDNWAFRKAIEVRVLCFSNFVAIMHAVPTSFGKMSMRFTPAWSRSESVLEWSQTTHAGRRNVVNLPRPLTWPSRNGPSTSSRTKLTKLWSSVKKPHTGLDVRSDGPIRRPKATD